MIAGRDGDRAGTGPESPVISIMLEEDPVWT